MPQSESGQPDTATAAALLLPPAAHVLVHGAEIVAGDRCTARPAALLLCDLSGFSRMGAQGIARSERGAEDLRRAINAVFDVVTDEITRAGGHVLYYAGDAVAAAWIAQGDDGLSKEVRAATSCGLTIQPRVSALDGALSMKAGLSIGTLNLIEAEDGQGRRVPLLAGSAIDGATRLELACPGVTLDARTARMARSVGILLEGQTAVTAPPLAPSEHRTPRVNAFPYLRTHQIAGLDMPSPEWLAEFRHAQILFAKVPDFRFDSEADLANVADFLRRAVSAIEGQGGTLLQICQDDKGLVVIGAWGLASSTFENGAARAVLAAQALVQAGPLTPTVALASGKVFCGLIGAEPYLQYSVVGDPINRAAALAGADLGPLVLDGAMQSSVDARFDTQEAARVQLKGQSAAQPVYRIIGARRKEQTHSAELVGRSKERLALSRFVIAAVTRGPRHIALWGDAGLGKSRLAAWLAQSLADKNVPALHIHADNLRRAISYAPFADFVHARLTPVDTASEQALQEAILRWCPDADPKLLSLLNPVLPRALPAHAEAEALSGAGRAARTQSILADVLAAMLAPEIAQGRDVLIVEDAHWLDSATWQMLDLLVRALPELRLCFVTRPLLSDELPTEVRHFLDPLETERLTLAPLSADETGTLAAQSLGAEQAAPPLTKLVHDICAGHPLFTAALAATLDARGLVQIEAGYAHLNLGAGSTSQLEIPVDVAGVVQERIAGLSASDQITLKTAAVLGRSFDTQTLAALHPSGQAEQVEQALQALISSGLIEDMGEGRWRFEHAIIADAAYSTLVTEQVQSLHSRAARLYTEAAGSAPDLADLALMSHHLERAGETARAIETLDAAAAMARDSYANLEVVEFLTRAMRLTGGDEAGERVDLLTMGRWRYDLAYALRAIGQYQRAEAFLKDCIRGLDRPPPETNGQALRGLLSGFATFKLRGHKSRQPEDIRAPIILAADATMMLSEIHYELNKIPFALAEILRGANLARRAGGDSATLAKLYIGMALISTSLPWALDGDTLQKDALDIVDRLDDPATESWVYMVSGNYESGKAGWAEGERMFKHAYDLSERCGERKTWETSASTLANLKRLEGWFEQAKGWSDITLATSRDRGIVQGIIWSHNGRARDLLCLNDWDALAEDVGQLTRLLSDPANANDANDNNKLVWHYADACLAFREGESDRALACLDAALEIVARTKRPQVYMTQNTPFYCDLICGLREQGAQDEEMLARQDLVAKTAKRVGKQYRSGVPMADFAAGDLAWMQGKSDEAEKHWRACAASAEARGMSYNAAHALDRITMRGLADESAARDAHLNRLGIELPHMWRFGMEPQKNAP